GAMLNTLAMPMFAISSPTAIEEAGPAYGTPSVGFSCTGPYRFVEWVSDDHISLERNPDYRGEIHSTVDTIIYRAIPKSATRIAALQAVYIYDSELPSVDAHEACETGDNTYMKLYL